MGDPKRHSPVFILGFVFKFGLSRVVEAQWAANYLTTVGEVARPYLTIIVQKGMANDAAFAEVWQRFAITKQQDFPNDIQNPANHDAGSLLEFFDVHGLGELSKTDAMT